MTEWPYAKARASLGVTVVVALWVTALSVAFALAPSNRGYADLLFIPPVICVWLLARYAYKRYAALPVD